MLTQAIPGLLSAHISAERRTSYLDNSEGPDSSFPGSPHPADGKETIPCRIQRNTHGVCVPGSPRCPSSVPPILSRKRTCTHVLGPGNGFAHNAGIISSVARSFGAQTRFCARVFFPLVAIPGSIPTRRMRHTSPAHSLPRHGSARVDSFRSWLSRAAEDASLVAPHLLFVGQTMFRAPEGG